MPDEADDDARRFGLAPLADWTSPGPDGEGIWEENLPALTAFLEVSGQWRSVSKGQVGTRWLGLDYTAVRAGFDLAGITMTPAVWAELRLIEAGATNELNEER